MSGITIIHYTANRISERFAANIRAELLSWLPKQIPIISVSQKPLDFGQNICCANLEYSIYSIYQQILIGAEAASTPYIMCHEDDALYNTEHFLCRPPLDTFLYNQHRWIIDHDIYFLRHRTNMSGCIAPRVLLIRTLKERFDKYKSLPEGLPFGEPGRFERQLGLTPVKIKRIKTKTPTIVFNHKKGVGGVRRPRMGKNGDIITSELPYWGRASDLWNSIYESVL
jgi:hypothetical protein